MRFRVYSLRKAYVLLILGFVSLLSSSCTQNKNESFKIGFSGSVQTLSPFKMTGHAAWQSTRFVTEPLFVKQNDNFIPALGLSYQISKKRKTLIVELRKNVKFHNGEKLTNKNIKFTYDCYMDESYGAGIWRPMYKGVESIELIGDYKFKIKFLKFSFNEVNNFITNFRILPMGFYSIKNKDKWNKKIIGTGPYRLKNFTPNGSIKLKRNDSWWGGQKNIEISDLTILYIKDASLAYQMNTADLLDIYPVDSIIDFLKDRNKKEISFVENKEEGSYQLYLRFNLKKDLFSLPIRKAVALLIDYKTINEKIFKGKLQRSLDSFDPRLKFYPKGPGVQYDPVKAGRILSEAGWLDLDKDGVREKIFEGKKRLLKFEILVSEYGEQLVATLIQESLKQHGIKADIQLMPSSNSLYQTMKDGKFDTQLRAGELNIAQTASYLNSKNFYNYSGYKNTKVDELTNKLDLTFYPDKRNRILRDIVLELRKDVRIAPGLHYKGSFYLVSKKTKINSEDPFNPVYWRRIK